jgi:Phosphotransferase enzyme family
VNSDEEVLGGGVANAGAVVRSGLHVLRPSNMHSASILSFLAQLEILGFDSAPSPVGIEPDGHERLRFISGDVAIPPFPDWAQTDETLGSVSILLRRLHDASQAVDTSAMTWSSEMADPEGGPVVCHNDVCLENVIFRNGLAIALIDFDFAAPGRRTYDLAAFARMCVPIDDDISSAQLGWQPSNRPGRLRLICDRYGLEAEGRADVLRTLSSRIAHGGEFVRRRVEAGEPGFVHMWCQMGGMERHDRLRRWWVEARPQFEAVLR